MEILPQLIVSGLAAGSLYALMALGMILIFKTTDVVNFAHGDMAMISSFVALTLMRSYHQPYWLAVLAAIAMGFALGALADLILRPARNAPILTLLIATLGISLMLSALGGHFFGYQTVSFPYALVGKPFVIAGVILTRHNALALGVAAALGLGLFALLKYTSVGTAMRAMAQNRLAAQLMGVNVRRVSTLSWGLGAALGAVAGVLIAPVVFLDLNTMITVLIKAFAAAVLGGFTSLPGAVVGGLLLGVLENLVGGYLSTQLQTTFVFLLIIAMLAIRPRGLLGAPVAGRRA